VPAADHLFCVWVHGIVRLWRHHLAAAQAHTLAWRVSNRADHCATL
jgi:hypothetical protein